MRDTHAQGLDRVQLPQTYLSTQGGNEMIPKHVQKACGDLGSKDTAEENKRKSESICPLSLR